MSHQTGSELGHAVQPKAASDAAPDFDGEHDPDRARLVSNALLRRDVQKKGGPTKATETAHAAAERGIASPAAPLPHADKIQSSFGADHDVSAINAHVGGDSAAAMGAAAYATGNHVVFDLPPDLHTAAHEAAHVVQQAQGVNLYGGVGEAGDTYERNADAVADRVVAGQSAADLLGGSTRGSAGTSRAVQMRPKDGEGGEHAAEPNAHGGDGVSDPTIPIGHESHKVKVEFKHGSLTGAINLTIESGKTGVPLGDDRIKAFKNTAGLKLNGFATKLETAVLNAKLDTEIFDGVKVEFEANVLKMGTDGKSVSTDPLTIGLKLTGNVAHWFGIGHDVKVQLEGSLQMGLGGKLLAEHLAKVAAAELEQKMLTTEITTVTETVGKHANAVKDLETQIAAAQSRGATRREIEALEHQLFEHKIQVSTGARQLERLGGELAQAQGRMARALGGVKNFAAKKIAKAMEVRAVKFVAEKLLKLIPILNVVSTIIDVVDLVQLIHALIKGKHGSGDGEGDETKEHAGQSGADKAPDHQLGATEGTATAGDAGHPTKIDPKSVAEARKTLSVPARAIVDSVKKPHGHGGEFESDQLTLLNAVIPPDLSQQEVRDVITTLHAGGATSRSSAEVFAQIETAVRQVRNRQRSVSVDGVDRPDLAHPDQAPITSPAQVDQGGPVTSPKIGDAGRTPATASQMSPQDEALVAVRSAPPAMIGQWFEARGEDLTMNDAGMAWKTAHLRMKVGNDELRDIVPIVTEQGSGKWDLGIVFEMRTANGAKREVRHNFMVERGGDATLGAKVGELVFEPFTMMGEAR